MIFTNEILKGLLKGGYEKAVREDKETFIAFYAYLFDDNDPCTTCNNKLRGYWDRLVNEGLDRLKNKNIIAKKEKDMQEELQPTEAIQDDDEQNTQDELQEDSNEPCKFRLRAGITSLAMDFGSSELFNNDTLTNEIAVRYLKINPNRIANFEVYPENWEELIN